MLIYFKKIYQKIQYFLLWCSAFIISSAYANLPTPPDSDMPDGSNDWIDVGGNLTYKVLSYCLIAIGAMILLGAAFGIFKAYHIAQDKQDLGYFFKHSAVAIASAAIGAGLLYAGYQIIPINS